MIEGSAKQWSLLKQQILDRQPFIRVSDAMMRPSKGRPGIGNIHMCRDFETEEKSQEILRGIGRREVLSRMRDVDPTVKKVSLNPSIYCSLLDADGPLVKLPNVFAFAPGFLGHISSDVDDHFALEFGSVWGGILDEIGMPCIARVFDEESQIRFYKSLCQQRNNTISGASTVHEFGHHALPIRVIPAVDRRLRITKFQFDVLGELAADAVGGTKFPEFSGVHEFNLVYRALFYARQRFHEDQAGANLADNDGFVGVLLWEKMKNAGALSQNPDGRYHYDSERAAAVWHGLVEEIKILLENLVKKPAAKQRAIAHEWMARNVSFNGQRFVLSDSLRQVFVRCCHVPELPRFSCPLRLLSRN